jgi:hypothetical protein
MGVSNPRNGGAHLLCAATAVAGVSQLQGNLPQLFTSGGSSPISSAAIDRQFIITPAATLGSAGIGCADSAVLKNSFSAVTSGTQSVATKLQHCATSGGTYADYTPPTGAAAIAADTTAAAGAHYVQVDLSGANRYLKTVTTLSAGTGAATFMWSDDLVLTGFTVETGVPTVA